MNEETNERTVHPAAALFPMMPDADLEKMAEDIRARGQLDPILLHDGMILDGRNRLAACKIAQVPARFAEAQLNGESPTAFVVSKNIHRRHLDVGQRAVIGVEILPMIQAEAQRRKYSGQLNGGGHGGRPPENLGAELSAKVPVKNPWANRKGGQSTEIAGKAVGVSRFSIARVLAVKEADPELYEKVRRGEVTPHKAARVIKGEVALGAIPKTPKPPKPSNGRRERPILESTIRRMYGVLGQIREGSRGLSQLPILGLSDGDRRAWARTARESRRDLLTLIGRLES